MESDGSRHSKLTKGGSSECNFVDSHVRSDGSSSDWSISRDDVDNSRWESGLLDELTHSQGRKRSLLGSLED